MLKHIQILSLTLFIFGCSQSVEVKPTYLTESIEYASKNIGAASATGIFAVILANIVAIFLLRIIGKSLMD